MECFPKNSQCYLTIIGGILTNLLIGSSLSMISILSYYLTYINQLRLHSENYQISQVFTSMGKNYYIIYSLIITTSNLTNSISTYITYRINIKTSLFISYIAITSSILITYSNNLSDISLTYLSFSLYGFGIGFPYQAIFRNAWEFFPNAKGFVSLLFICAFAVSSPIFDFLFTKTMVMNNNNKGELNIVNAKKFLWYCFLAYNTICFVIAILSFDNIYDDEYDSTTERSISKLNNSVESEREIRMSHLKNTKSNMISRRESQEEVENIMSRKQSYISDLLLNNSSVYNSNINTYGAVSTENTINYQLFISFKEAIFNWRIYYIILVYFLSFIYSFNTMIKLLGYQYHMEFPLKTIQYNTFIFIIAVSISKVIIPLLFISQRSFKFMQLSVLLIQMGVSFYMAFFMGKNGFYDMDVYLYYVVISGICFSVNSTTISPLIQQIYGDELSMILSGFVIGFSCLSIWVVCVEWIYLEKICENNAINLIFIISGISSIVAFVLMVSLNDTKFDYMNIKTLRKDEYNKNDIDYKEKIILNDDKSKKDNEH